MLSSCCCEDYVAAIFLKVLFPLSRSLAHFLLAADLTFASPQDVTEMIFLNCKSKDS